MGMIDHIDTPSRLLVTPSCSCDDVDSALWIIVIERGWSPAIHRPHAFVGMHMRFNDQIDSIPMKEFLEFSLHLIAIGALFIPIGTILRFMANRNYPRSLSPKLAKYCISQRRKEWHKILPICVRLNKIVFQPRPLTGIGTVLSGIYYEVDIRYVPRIPHGVFQRITGDVGIRHGKTISKMFALI